jgi:hypothetical protein
MNETKTAEAPAKFGATSRTDAWWFEPALVATGFTLFIVYATWRALFDFQYAEWQQYLSPFFSPQIKLPGWEFSPAILILWVPAGFRATCYYYRKAYYRAYFMDPPACSVGHFGGHKYCGETSFPLILQNMHRYFLYLAIIVVGFLWWDAIKSFYFEGHFTMGLGSLILLANSLFLSMYTFGCHAFRHLVGGRLDCFSCSSGAQTQFKLWHLVTKLNEHHMLWAWVSLFGVGFSDFYVRMLAAGVWHDIKFF